MAIAPSGVRPDGLRPGVGGRAAVAGSPGYSGARAAPGGSPDGENPAEAGPMRRGIGPTEGGRGADVGGYPVLSTIDNLHPRQDASDAAATLAEFYASRGRSREAARYRELARATQR